MRARPDRNLWLAATAVAARTGRPRSRVAAAFLRTPNRRASRCTHSLFNTTGAPTYPSGLSLVAYQAAASEGDAAFFAMLDHDAATLLPPSPPVLDAALRRICAAIPICIGMRLGEKEKGSTRRGTGMTHLSGSVSEEEIFGEGAENRTRGACAPLCSIASIRLSEARRNWPHWPHPEITPTFPRNLAA